MKDTIAAVATAMSPSGIGIVRISGPESFAVADRIYRSKGGGKKLSDQKSHTVHYGYIYDGDVLIDEVLVVLLRAPKSYTGEDTVEIDCHGGVLVMEKIWKAALHNGAVPAEPGEFTKRAFLNGRLDLSQAEAVMDVIGSRNEFARKSAVSQLKGSVSRTVKALRETILYEIAYIESALDDPEHISLEDYPERLKATVSSIIKDMKQMLESAEYGKVLSEGIRTVIVGKPNAGKSSLLNALLGEEKAIVTDIAGTTRDVLEQEIRIGGLSLLIMDTAGIRESQDVVEKIGVDKAKKEAEEADLILYVVDSSVPLDENDWLIIELLQKKKAIVLFNKNDLEPVISEKELSEKTGCQVLSISASRQEGIEELAHAIQHLFLHGEITFNEEVYLTNERQKAALTEALNSMMMVERSIEEGMPEDFFSIDLMNAYQKLGLMIGEEVEEDLVNEIFSKFCMGK